MLFFFFVARNFVSGREKNQSFFQKTKKLGCVFLLKKKKPRPRVLGLKRPKNYVVFF